MQEQEDRGIPGSGTIIAAAVVIMLLASSGLVLWWKMKAASPSVDRVREGTSMPSAPVPLDVAVPFTVYLPVADILAPSAIPIKRQLDAQSQAREVVVALLSEDVRDRGPVLSGVQMREVYLDASGTAYVDVAVVPKEGIRSSAWDELLAIASVTTSIMHNVEEVRRVRFLIDGREAQALAGHIDLTRSFQKRMDLVK